MLNPNDLFRVNKAYRIFLDPVCDHHDLTRIELDILLFLANSPQYTTASDIVKRRFLTKSHVSSAIRTLTEKGLIQKEFRNENKKTVHLILLSSSEEIIQEGQQTQIQFIASLKEGIPSEEMERFKETFSKIMTNADRLL